MHSEISSNLYKSFIIKQLVQEVELKLSNFERISQQQFILNIYRVHQIIIIEILYFLDTEWFFAGSKILSLTEKRLFLLQKNLHFLLFY